MKRNRVRDQIRRNFRKEFLEAVLAALMIAVLLRIFVISVYRLPSESMAPSLIPGDVVIALKTAYGVSIPFTATRLGARVPDRGDVVVFRHPNEDVFYIKRVVGVPGDRIEIRDGELKVNEAVREVSSSQVKEPAGEWRTSLERNGQTTHRVIRRANAEADFLVPQVVPPGHVFLLGDLRSDSLDSRHFGPISIEAIDGRAGWIAFSLGLGRGDESSLVPDSVLEPGNSNSAGFRWNRFLKKIE